MEFLSAGSGWAWRGDRGKGTVLPVGRFSSASPECRSREVSMRGVLVTVAGLFGSFLAGCALAPKPASVEEKLECLSRHEELEVRIAAMEVAAFLRIEDGSFSHVALECLKSKDKRTLLRGLNHIGEFEIGENRDGILDKVKTLARSGDHHIQYAALVALRTPRLRDAGTIDLVLEILESEPSPFLIEPLFWVIAAIGTSEDADRVHLYLGKKGNDHLNRSAIRVFETLGTMNHVDYLEAMLSQLDPGIRHRAASALIRIAPEREKEWSGGLDPDWCNVRHHRCISPEEYLKDFVPVECPIEEILKEASKHKIVFWGEGHRYSSAWDHDRLRAGQAEMLRHLVSTMGAERVAIGLEANLETALVGVLEEFKELEVVDLEPGRSKTGKNDSLRDKDMAEAVRKFFEKNPEKTLFIVCGAAHAVGKMKVPVLLDRENFMVISTSNFVPYRTLARREGRLDLSESAYRLGPNLYYWPLEIASRGPFCPAKEKEIAAFEKTGLL